MYAFGMQRRAVTPKSLILDLLRVTAPVPLGIHLLISVGAHFGFTANASRVAVARLVARGLVEAHDRASYRLSPSVYPLNSYVERWRLGEKRVRAWTRTWLLAYVPVAETRVARQEGMRALSLLGFRKLFRGMWVRPDNLADDLRTTRATLLDLGLDERAECFAVTELSERLARRLTSKTWDVVSLSAKYATMLRALQASAEHLSRLPLERALVESFELGGQAIRLLATDPLLPVQMLPGPERSRLSAAALHYDAIGRRVWSRALGGIALGQAPSHLAIAEAS